MRRRQIPLGRLQRGKGGSMIQLIRIDDRLLHGQVAYSWKSELNYNAIVIASDVAASDDVRKMAIKLCAPEGVKLAVRTVDGAAELLNNPKLDKMNVFVICANPEDVVRLTGKIKEKPIVNLGGMQKRDHTIAFSKAVFVDKPDIKALDHLQADGFRIEVRQVPSYQPVPYESLRRKITY